MKGLCDKFENKPECPYKSFCDHNKYNFKNKPVYWFFNFPPYLNEFQVNFLKWWHNNGAETIRMCKNNTGDHIMIFLDEYEDQIGYAHEKSFKILFEHEYEEYKLSELIKEYE